MSANINSRFVTSIDENIKDYISQLQQRNDVAGEELSELKQTRGKLQLMKEELLQRRLELDGGIQTRRRVTTATRDEFPDATGKQMFDNIFSLVDSCYHKQLLRLELQDQLTVARALREERQYVDLIKGLTGTEISSKDEKENTLLHAWYREMKDYAQNSSPSNSALVPKSERFFHIKMSSDNVILHGCSSQTLAFTTRHKECCLRLTLSLTSTCYTISSDIQLEGLQVKGHEYLQIGCSATEFLEKIVWLLMEEQLCI